MANATLGRTLPGAAYSCTGSDMYDGDGWDDDGKDDEDREDGDGEEDDDSEDRGESCNRLRKDKASNKTDSIDDTPRPACVIPMAVESKSKDEPAKSRRPKDDAAETEENSEMGNEVAGEYELDDDEDASVGNPNCEAKVVACDSVAYGLRSAYFLK